MLDVFIIVAFLFIIYLVLGLTIAIIDLLMQPKAWAYYSSLCGDPWIFCSMIFSLIITSPCYMFSYLKDWKDIASGVDNDG